MKKLITIAITVLLLSTTLISIDSSSAKQHTDNKIINLLQKLKNNIEKYRNLLKQNNIPEFNEYVFKPEDIKLKDDAFHGADSSHYSEWWYFDAVFDNGYSIHIGMQMVNILQRYFVLLKINIYKDGDLIKSNEKICLMNNFYTSYDTPLIEVNEKQVMQGHIDPNTGEWIYNISLKIDDLSADLKFIGTAKGFKGASDIGSWAVILPRANVTGTITIKNNQMEVSGLGYHDHNWETTARCTKNFGWIWGKFNTESYSIVWALIMKTRINTQPLLVLTNENEYINIYPDDIQIVPIDYQMEDGRLVPYLYCLYVNMENITIYLTMEVLGDHHIQIGPLKYWRFHVKCEGSLTYNSVIEKIDETQIIEYIRFR